MTLGIQAIAGWHPQRGKWGTGREAIVLVADKEYEVGGRRVTSPVPKRLGIIQRTARGRCGWFCLFAASDTSHVDDFIDRIRTYREVHAIEAGRRKPPTARFVMNLVERAYRAERHRNRSFDPELVIGGFDEENRPVILSIDEGVRAENQKVPAQFSIGSGGCDASTRLAWHNTQPDDPLYRVLYKAFDAKRHAEKAVGDKTDMWILSLRREQPVQVPRSIQVTMGEAFRALEAPVFRGQKREPVRWRERLQRQVSDFVRDVRAMPDPSSNATAPLSSLSRSVAPPRVSQRAPSRPSVRLTARAQRQRGSSRRSRRPRSEQP